jgi:hypothetical protein
LEGGGFCVGVLLPWPPPMGGWPLRCLPPAAPCCGIVLIKPVSAVTNELGSSGLLWPCCPEFAIRPGVEGGGCGLTPVAEGGSKGLGAGWSGPPCPAFAIWPAAAGGICGSPICWVGGSCWPWFCGCAPFPVDGGGVEDGPCPVPGPGGVSKGLGSGWSGVGGAPGRVSTTGPFNGPVELGDKGLDAGKSEG